MPSVLGPAYQRTAFQSMTVKLDGKDGFKQLKAALAADPRLKLDAETTRDYYGKQSQALTTLINILGKVIGAIMAIGAVFGALELDVRGGRRHARARSRRCVRSASAACRW